MLPPMNLPTAVRALRARPIAVVAAVLMAATFANALLVGCGGKSQEQSTSSTTPSTETPPAATTDTSSMAGGDLGTKVYTERCVLCHGPEGKGNGPGAAGLDPKPRDHTDGAYMNARTNDQLIEVIKNGKGNMPAWGAILSDAEVHAVLGHVRKLAQPPYTGPMP